LLNRRNFLLSGAAMLAVSAARASSPNHGQWVARADMPFAVQEIYPTSVMINGQPAIMNAGGFRTGGDFPVTNETTLYNPVADRWRHGVALPFQRHHIALASVDDHIYAIGGYGPSDGGLWNMRSEVIRIKDPEKGEWQAASALPTPQAEAMCVAHNGLIHMIGGRKVIAEKNQKWQDHVDTNAHWVFDPLTQSWSKRAPLPTARNSGAVAELNGTIYVLSGRTVAAGNTPVCEVYDPDEDRWRTIAPLPVPIRQPAPQGQGGLAAAARGGKVYCFGGEWFSEKSGVYADSWEYDPSADSWRAVAAMPRPRHGLGAVNLPDGIYTIGGATGPGGEGNSPFIDRFTL